MRSEMFFQCIPVEGFEDMEFYRFGSWFIGRYKGNVKWFYKTEWTHAEFRKFQQESDSAEQCQAKQLPKKVA